MHSAISQSYAGNSHQNSGTDTGIENLYKHFPTEAGFDLSQSEASQLQKDYPVRYELLRRAETGFTYVDRKHRHVTPELLPGLNRLKSYLLKHSRGEDVVLYDSQIPVLSSLSNFLENGLRSGYVVVPTRGGKTVIFQELLKILQVKSLVLEPTKDLVIQTRKAFKKFSPDLDVGVHYGDIKEGLDHTVVISTYDAWLAARKRNEIVPGQFPIIILDEGHEALSDKKREELQQFIEQDLVLAFTATDKFNEFKSLRSLLKTQIHKMSIREAIGLELICPFSVITVETSLDLSEVETDFSRGEYNRVQLDAALSEEQFIQSVVQLYKDQFDGQVGMISCAGVTSARAYARAFRTAGVSALAFHGGLTKDEREVGVKLHKKGSLKILAVDKLLLRGYDNPKVDFIFNIAPTMSLVKATQRGGRPLTPDVNNPDKIGSVVEFLHHDVQRRRRQITLIDATLAAYIPAPKPLNNAVTRAGAKKTRPTSTEIDGLKVTCNPAEVMEVVKERAAGSRIIKRKQYHKSDRFNLEIKSVHKERHRSMMQLGLTTKFYVDIYEKRKQKSDELCKGLAAVAWQDAENRSKRMLEQPMSTRNLSICADDNREVLLHIERKFRGHGLFYEDFLEIRKKIDQAWEKLSIALMAVDSVIPDSCSISAVELLKHFDDRVSDIKLPEDLLDQVYLELGEEHVADLVRFTLAEEVKPIESDVYARWDLLYDVVQELSDQETTLDNLRQELVKVANKVIKESIVGFVGRTLTRQELKQEAWVLASEVIDEFITKGCRSRFYTYLTKKMTAALELACDQADQASLNYSYFVEDPDLRLKPVQFFSELARPAVEAGEEVSEHDYDEEEFLELFEDTTWIRSSLNVGKADIWRDEVPVLTSEELNHALQILDTRRRNVIIDYFGLEDGEQKTFKELVKTFKVTPTRANQLYRQGIRKMREYFRRRIPVE